jgi:hypothetical protein
MSALKCESFVLHVPAQRQFASRGMRVTPLDTSLRLGRSLTTYMVMSDGNFLAVLKLLSNISALFLIFESSVSQQSGIHSRVATTIRYKRLARCRDGPERLKPNAKVNACGDSYDACWIFTSAFAAVRI